MTSWVMSDKKIKKKKKKKKKTKQGLKHHVSILKLDFLKIEFQWNSILWLSSFR